VFWRLGLIFAKTNLDCDPPILTFCLWNVRHLPPCQTFAHWDRILQFLFIYFFGLGWFRTTILPISVFHIDWNDRCEPPCPPVGWNGVSWTTPSGWPGTMSLPISDSQVARITGMSTVLAFQFFLPFSCRDRSVSNVNNPILKCWHRGRSVWLLHIWAIFLRSCKVNPTKHCNSDLQGSWVVYICGWEEPVKLLLDFGCFSPWETSMSSMSWVLGRGCVHLHWVKDVLGERRARPSHSPLRFHCLVWICSLLAQIAQFYVYTFHLLAVAIYHAAFNSMEDPWWESIPHQTLYRRHGLKARGETVNQLIPVFPPLQQVV
jgi:hypothetical protein